MPKKKEPQKPTPKKSPLEKKIEKIRQTYATCYETILEDASVDEAIKEREFELLQVAINTKTTDTNVLAARLNATKNKIEIRYRSNPSLKVYVERIQSAQKGYWRELQIAMADEGDKPTIRTLLSEAKKRVPTLDKQQDVQDVLDEFSD